MSFTAQSSSSESNVNFSSRIHFLQFVTIPRSSLTSTTLTLWRVRAWYFVDGPAIWLCLTFLHDHTQVCATGRKIVEATLCCWCGLSGGTRFQFILTLTFALITTVRVCFLGFATVTYFAFMISNLWEVFWNYGLSQPKSNTRSLHTWMDSQLPILLNGLKFTISYFCFLRPWYGSSRILVKILWCLPSLCALGGTRLQTPSPLRWRLLKPLLGSSRPVLRSWPSTRCWEAGRCIWVSEPPHLCFSLFQNPLPPEFAATLLATLPSDSSAL